MVVDMMILIVGGLLVQTVAGRSTGLETVVSPVTNRRFHSLTSDADRIITAGLKGLRSTPRMHSTAAPFPAPQFVTQPQDHFDKSNTNTWSQAFYVNDKYWKGAASEAPVYVCVGGEGPPLDGSVVVSSVHCNNAVEWLPETGALMLALEHRYYGCHNASACPVTSFGSSSALRFLSSRQALADLAHFHEVAVARWGLTSANKWVSWGGSYPGMLAGWFRLKYPNLIHASVASSAPVQAQLDMQGYNDVVASAYSVSDNDVGGSPACTAAIATGHATIKSMFNTSSGRDQLSKFFHMPADFFKSPSNQGDFAGNGVAYFPAQGNDPSCTQPGCNIKEICKIMTDSSRGSAVERLAALRSDQLDWLGDTPATLGRPFSAEADYWGYQTCTEFGFYQTCEVGSKCFYAQGYVTLDAMDSFCKDEFGIEQAQIAASIDDTNAFYGGDKPSGSCVLYPNGEVDPWHSLSVLSPPGNGIEVLMVPGASHHAWTHPSDPSDQPSVVAARATIRQTVTTFLAQGCEQPNTTVVVG